MVKYELYYFEATGRAEVQRWLLHYAGIQFNDRRVVHEEWIKIKDDKKLFPYGTMPILWVDNERIAESHVITRYLGKLAKLDHADDPIDAAHLDEVYEIGRSFFDAVFPFVLISLDQMPGDKEKAFKEIFVPSVEKYFPIIEGHIKSNGWFSEKGLSYVDFYWAAIVDMFLPFTEQVIRGHPKSVEHMEKVKALPQLQQHLKSRK